MRLLLMMMLFPLLSFSQKRSLTSDIAVLRGAGVYPFTFKRSVDAHITLSSDSILIISQLDSIHIRITELSREVRGDTLVTSYSGMDTLANLLTFHILKVHDTILSIKVSNGRQSIDFLIDEDDMEENNL